MVGRLVARAVIGGLFVGHGTQKLFGWFEGPGPAGTEQMMGKALADAGPGTLSLDRALRTEKAGPGWALAALGAGALASAATIELARRQAPDTAEPATDPAARDQELAAAES